MTCHNYVGHHYQMETRTHQLVLKTPKKSSQFDDQQTHGQMFMHDVILRDEAAEVFDLRNATWAHHKNRWCREPCFNTMARQSTNRFLSNMEPTKNTLSK